MAALRLRVQLDPPPEHRAQLAAYPAADLWPDLAVLTTGALALDIGAHAVAYRRGRLAPLPAGSDDPAVWLPDYLGGFLPRLAAAVLSLALDRPTHAHLLDAPAALTFQQQGRQVSVAYEDRGRPVYQTTLTVGALRAAVADALASFLTQLLALNPRLAEQPEVAALLRQHAALS